MTYTRIMAELTTGEYVPAESAKKLFIEAFLATGRVKTACDQIGLVNRTFYHWKNNDPEFLKQFEMAQQMLITYLEDEAYRRAVVGVERPIYQGGKLAGHVTDYSDALLTLLLKATNPAKYKDKSSTELTGPNGRPLIEGMKMVHVHSQVPLASGEDEVDMTIEAKSADYIDHEEVKPETDDLSSL